MSRRVEAGRAAASAPGSGAGGRSGAVARSAWRALAVFAAFAAGVTGQAGHGRRETGCRPGRRRTGPAPGYSGPAPNRVAGGSPAPEPRRPAGSAGPPRLARLLRRAGAGLLVAAGLVCAAAPAAAQEAAEVPQFWPLVPSGLGPGDKFRLLFVTEERRASDSTDIADYNAFVQGRAKSGHRAIREFASKFRVLGSTASDNARDNTGTTSSDTDAKIYWLNGSKVADSYVNFYDGSWDSAAKRNPSGNTIGANIIVSTGTRSDGTTAVYRLGGTVFNPLVGTETFRVTIGRIPGTELGPTRSNEEEAENYVSPTSPLRFYALSPVFTIVRAAGVSGVSIPSTPASGDSYGAGERVRVRLTFTEAVDVTGTPHVWLNVGGAARRADHVSGSGTKHLEFAYTVLAEDFDADGVRLCSSTTLNAGCGRVSLNGGTVAASSDGFAPDLDHPEQGDQSGDKVDGGSAGPASGVPTIAGTPRVGQVLMAGTAHIRDPDGLDSVSYEYRWIRVDRGLETEIAGAEASTYTLAAADAGKRIRVRVEFDDDAGNAESLTGAAYPAGSTVMAAAPAACAAPDLAGRRQIWTGTVTVEGVTVGPFTAAGFNDDPDAFFSSFGSLPNPDFDIGAGSNTIDAAYLQESSGSSELLLSLTSSLAAGEAASLTLHVCDDAFALGDATHFAAQHNYTWTAANLDWSGVTTRTLYLSVADTVAPAGFAPPPPPMGAVPADWPLTPAEVEPGERFRLLFITTGKRDAESSDIADYNAFVQNAAASGHASIRRHSSGFRAVASTPGVDARDNSATTGTGVKIFWLNGNKLADDYADFYDGDWDDEVNRTNENGSSESDKSVWTGSDDDGTELISSIANAPDRSRALGASGGQNKSTNGALDSASGSPFVSGASTTQSFNLPLYGLSQVFIAGGGAQPDALEFASAPASGDTYARGETILIDASFTGAVSVRGMPTLDLEIGSRQVRARYRSGSGTARLRFAYVLQAGELDEDGVRVAGHDTENRPFNLDGATIEAVDGGAAAGLTFAALDDDAGHKVDAQAARATGVSIPSAPADGTAYAAGETVTVALAMSEPVLVTGTPQVRLGVGGAVQLAAYVGPRGTATSELRFAYTVQAGDFDSDGLQICSHRAAGCGRIALDGGTVRAASDGTDADLRHPEQDADADDKVDAGLTPIATGGVACPPVQGVPDDWALKPSGLDEGDKFRLLFVTSSTRTATDTEIASYNGFVQNEAADGHASIQKYSGNFRVVGSTAGVDARTNTCTTGTGVGIHWLNGARVANNYGNFYDGTWDSVLWKDQDGDARDYDEVWTGTNNDGTTAGNYLGHPSRVTAGTEGSGRALSSTTRPHNAFHRSKPVYALSQIFVVGATPGVTDREVRSSPAIGDTYRLDEPIEIALRFSEKVAVQGTPWLNLAIGSGRGRAEYVDGSGTDTLVFRHVVQAGDRDTNGFQVIGNDGIVLDGATILTLDGLDIDTALPGSWIEGDKVDGSLVLTGGVCGRTAQVREFIMDEIIPRSTAAGTGIDCSEVTLELIREATTGLRRFSVFLKDKGIESLKAGDFEGFEAARIVELNGNRLTTLPAGLFDGLGEVTDLRLQDNALTSLQAGAFAGLDKLDYLDLSNNALAAGAIDDEAFEGLTRLSTLKLEGNPGAATFGPGADAGTGRTLSAGEVVTLEGKATGTGPWGNNVRYAWTQTDGEDNEISPPTVTLSATDVPRPTFTVPVLNSGATVKLKLTVTGRGGLSASSTATFTILPLAVTDVSIVSIPQADDTYRENETIEVAVTFGDTVLVDTAGGRPTIRIDLTVNPVRAFRPASYARGSGTNRLVFAYTVQAADRDSDGLGVVEGTLALNGGTITSVNGAKALLLNAAVAASSSHKVDGGTPALDLALGVCDRTPQVRDALVAKVTAASDCSQVTDTHLAAITGTLDLRPSETGSTMTGLKAGDFESLSGVTSLILTSNRLRDIPAGVFDEMVALTSLELNSNGTAADDGLTSLPAGLFDKLERLGQLDLSNNDLASLPPRLFEKLTALTRLVLGSNPGSARFLPLAKAGPGDGLDAAAGTEVTLGVAGAEDGLDDPWGDNVEYTWTQPGGEEVDLSATDVARPTFTAPVSADGTTLTFQLKVQGLGHGSSDDLHTATATVDVRVGAAPAVTGVGIASVPVAGSTYRPGETIEVAVTFSAPVAVDTAGGTPAVSLDLSPGDGDTSRSAGYDRGTGTNRLVFAYAVQAGDADSDGFEVGENGLAAGGGAIRGLDGATVLLAHDGVEGGDGHRIAGSLAALTGGICGRTPQVRAAILERAQANDETVETCADVTGIHLEGLTGTLDLDGLGSANRIASLKAGDFAGLSGIVRLDLDNNRLRTVPAGVFDEMTALTRLSMSYNQTGAADSLMTLPAGLFDRLTGLTSLGLAHNDLKTLPAHIFEKLTALDSLALDGNPGSANFVPLAKAGPEGGLDAAAGATVTLGAEGAEDGPGDPWGTNVTYSWTQVSGETVELSATGAARPTFTVPASAEASELVFELAVTGRGATGSNAHRATRRLTVRVVAAPVGPAVTDVSIVSVPQAGDTYRAGETIEVALTFDGTVLVDTAGGTPTIQLSANFEGLSGYVRGSGTNRLVFAYTVQAADMDDDGIGVLQSRLRLNGGTISAREEPGAEAQLLHSGVEASLSHKVDGDGTPALTGGVCDRTPQVRDALVAKVTAASDCSEVTDAHLAAITGTLDLRPSETGSTMTGLKAGDFESLSGVTSLILTSNRLRDIPAGVFDEMVALTSLELNSNGTAADDGLTSLPAGLFDKLERLGQLDLSNNDLASLPPRLFEKLTALTRLVLGSNPGSARFLPLAKAGPGDGLDAAAGTEVTLGVAGANGREGHDDPWGDNVEYTWTQPGGEEVDLSATDVARPTFTVPASADGTTLTFQLKVQGEGHGSSDDLHTATATVDVRIGSAGMAPMLVSAAVKGKTLTLTYDKKLKDTNPTASVYLVAIVDGVDGLRLTRPTSVTASGDTVTMTLEEAVRRGQTVTLSYYPEDATAESRVQGEGGIEAPGFVTVAVRNEGPEAREVDFKGAAKTYKFKDAIEVLLTFTDDVAVRGMPYLELEVGAETHKAVYKSGTGSATLLFSYTVAEGDADRDGVAVVQDSLALGGGTIRSDDDDDADVILRNPTLSDADRRVDGVSPTAISARVAGPDLTVTFSEPLDPDSAPAAGAGGFAVAIDGGENPAVTAVSVSKRTVTLKLSAPVLDGTTGVTVSYAPPADPLRDTAGNAALATPGDGVAVTVPPDTQDPPTFLSAAVRGDVLTLTYDEPLEPGTPTPLSSHPVYEVVAVGGERTVDTTVKAIMVGVGTGGNLVTLTLSEAVTHEHEVTVSYYPALATPGSEVRDRAGQEAEELLSKKVKNETPEGPSVEGFAFRGAAQTYAIGDEIVVEATFSEPVAVTGTPYVELDIGGATRRAVWKPGQAAGEVQVFVYTVDAGDEDADGVAVVRNSLALNGGTIRTARGRRQRGRDPRPPRHGPGPGAQGRRGAPDAGERDGGRADPDGDLERGAGRDVGADGRGRVHGAVRHRHRPEGDGHRDRRRDDDAQPGLANPQRHGERDPGIHPALFGRGDPRRGRQRRQELHRPRGERGGGHAGAEGHRRDGRRRDACRAIRRAAGREFDPGGAGRVRGDGDPRRQPGLRRLQGDHARALPRRQGPEPDAVRGGGAGRRCRDAGLCEAGDGPAAGPGDDAEPGRGLLGPDGREPHPVGADGRLPRRGAGLRDRRSDRGRGDLHRAGAGGPGGRPAAGRARHRRRDGTGGLQVRDRVRDAALRLHRRRERRGRRRGRDRGGRARGPAGQHPHGDGQPDGAARPRRGGGGPGARCRHRAAGGYGGGGQGAHHRGDLVGGARRDVGAGGHGRVHGAARRLDGSGGDRGGGGRHGRDEAPAHDREADRRRHPERHAGIHPVLFGHEDPRQGRQRRRELHRPRGERDPGHRESRGHRRRDQRQGADAEVRRAVGRELDPGGAGRVQGDGDPRRQHGRPSHGDRYCALAGRQGPGADAGQGGRERRYGDARLRAAVAGRAAGPGGDAEQAGGLHDRDRRRAGGRQPHRRARAPPRGFRDGGRRVGGADGRGRGRRAGHRGAGDRDRAGGDGDGGRGRGLDAGQGGPVAAGRPGSGRDDRADRQRSQARGHRDGDLPGDSRRRGDRPGHPGNKGQRPGGAPGGERCGGRGRPARAGAAARPGAEQRAGELFRHGLLPRLRCDGRALGGRRHGRARGPVRPALEPPLRLRRNGLHPRGDGGAGDEGAGRRLAAPAHARVHARAGLQHGRPGRGGLAGGGDGDRRHAAARPDRAVDRGDRLAGGRRHLAPGRDGGIRGPARQGGDGGGQARAGAGHRRARATRVLEAEGRRHRRAEVRLDGGAGRRRRRRPPGHGDRSG